jgi:hypothetical protein
MTVQIKTIKASGGDYTTLQAFEDAAAVSSTNDDPWHAECYSGVNMGGFTKGAWSEEPSAESERVKIYAAPGHEHDGSWSTSSGAYSSITSGQNIKIYNQRGDYFTFEGLLLLNSKNNGNCILQGGSSTSMKIEFKRLWSKMTHATPTSSNMYFTMNASSPGDSEVLFENCVLWRGTSGLYVSSAPNSPDTTYNIRNCTIYGMSTHGMNGAFTWGSQVETLNLQNMAVGESGSNDYLLNVPEAYTYANNISTDATADDDGGSNHQINVDEDDIWVDAPNGDFRLVHGSKAKDKGVAIAEVVTDITGVRRPQGGYHDCGAYEEKRVGSGRMRSYNRRKGRLRVRGVRARRG